jgi:phage gp36-like protein
MRFLIKRDYAAQIREHVKNIIGGHNDYTIEDAEDAAIEQASSYLRGRYNLESTFPALPIFSSTAQYNEGDYVVSTADRIYKALVDDPGTDLSDTADWKPEDPRNKHLITIVVDLTLYLLFTNTGRQLSELRVKRYDDAIKWLEKVQKEELSPALPLIDEDKPSGQYLMGSDTKYRDRW